MESWPTKMRCRVSIASIRSASVSVWASPSERQCLDLLPCDRPRSDSGLTEGPACRLRLPTLGRNPRRPLALGQVATGLLDVLPVKQHTSPEHAYLRQTTRTNNAAVVAEGAAKPTSVYSVVRVEQSLIVVAHLSEGMPRYWLLDNSALETFVVDELLDERRRSVLAVRPSAKVCHAPDERSAAVLASTS